MHKLIELRINENKVFDDLKELLTKNLKLLKLIRPIYTGQNKRPILNLKTPKPLFELNNLTMLEVCINLIIKQYGNLINTYHLGNKIEFIDKKRFSIEIRIIEDGKEILNTGGGILNMINHSDDKDFLIFNPDTVWHKNYIEEINKMKKFYFSQKLNNIL